MTDGGAYQFVGAIRGRGGPGEGSGWDGCRGAVETADRGRRQCGLGGDGEGEVAGSYSETFETLILPRRVQRQATVVHSLQEQTGPAGIPIYIATKYTANMDVERLKR